METGETCKLCLKYAQGTNMTVLDETILGKLEFLQMDLDKSVEESNSVCKECEEKIENAFEFKSCVVNTESCLVPYVSEDKTQKVNLRLIIEKDTSNISVGDTSAEKEVCRLCKKIVDSIAVISLPKIFKDDSIMEVFQGHIPEIDVEVTDNPVVCETCQKSLTNFSTLVSSWSIANGINDMDGECDEDMKADYEDDFEVVKVKDETTDYFSDSYTTSSTSMLDISDSAKTDKKTKKGKSATITVKTESNSCEMVSEMNQGLKNDIEVVSEENNLQLKNEELEIKDEDGFSTAIIKSENHKDVPEVLKCSECPLVTKYKWHLEDHMLTHKNDPLKISRKLECPECPFSTRYKSSFREHVRKHKKRKEVKTYKCPECSHITNYVSHLNAHIKVKHESMLNGGYFICFNCTYLTKNKSRMIRHQLTHRRISDVTSFQCKECRFVTKYKADLKRHNKKHENINMSEMSNKINPSK